MITITHGLVQGQVLQRLSNDTATVGIQGSSEQDGPVEVRLFQGEKPSRKWGRKVVGKARRGRFSVEIKGLPVGGPYRIVFKIGGETLTVDDIFVGDVWILAGQSNMEGCGSLEAPTSPDDRVRALYMGGNWGRAEDPLHCHSESPDRVHAPIPMTAPERQRQRQLRTKGVGPGISFGAEMVRRSGGVPQGVIACAHGATSMRLWTPRRKSEGGGSLFGSLLRVCKATGQPVAGILWYQGESDAQPEPSKVYFRDMVKLIAAFRKDLKQPDLAFIMAQIGREFNQEAVLEPWNQIQLDQAKLAKHVARVACVAAVDLPMEDNIHLSSEGQARMGRRLAAEADRLVYGNRNELPPPELKSVLRLREPKSYCLGKYGVEVTFKNVVGGLRSDGSLPAFGLIDKSGNVTHPFYRAEICGNKVRLEATRNIFDPEDCRLVYGYGRNPAGLLSDARDHAVAVFGPAPIFDPLAPTLPFSKWRISKGHSLILSVAEVKSAPRPDGMKLTRCERPTYITPEPQPPVLIEGVVFFFAEIEAPEAMRGNLRFGYDAPFKLWLDDKPVFTDLHGTNPIVIDEIVRPVQLSKGRHRLTVAMDFRSGTAWGFVIRFARSGLSLRQIQSGGLCLPFCC